MSGIKLPERPLWQKMAISVAACTTTALLATPLFTWLDPANIVMLFLLTVLLVAVVLGMEPALLAAFLCVALFDFFFVPPRFSFAVNDAQYVVTFGVMLLVAIITGRLAAGLRQRADDAAAEAGRSKALYEMARDLSGALTSSEVSRITGRFLHQVIEADGVLLFGDPLTGLQALAEEHLLSFQIEPRVAMVAFEHGDVVECAQLADSGYAVLYLPLKASMCTRGVVAVAPLNGDVGRIRAQRQRLETMASLVAITLERIHYAEVAQRSQVDVASERLRSSILSALSHDLRTPLTALVGLADSLVDRRQCLSQAAHDTAVALRDQAEYLAGLVANLLDMARLHAGKVLLQKEWQPIDEVIGSSIKLLGKALSGRVIDVRLPKDLPLINFDAVLIERVFCNVLENAAKYSPPGTPIGIEAGIQGGDLWVAITDCGAGFSTAQGGAIFDMFVRGEAPSKKPGVGLGLAICRAIVVAHDGEIQASNRPEGGGCLRFSLPLGTPPSIEEEPTLAPVEDPSR